MIPFALAQVEAFAAVVRLGSVSSAAAELGLTQPSVTQRLRELERSLGARLFVRHGRGVRPTAAARALLGYAERMLATARDAADRFREHDVFRGVLRLGVTDSFALVALPDLLRRLEERYPRLQTSVRVDDSGTMSGMLDRGELDIAIIGDPETGAEISRELIGSNDLAWIERAEGSAVGPVMPAEMAGRHLIVNAPPSRLHAAAKRWFGAAGVDPSRMSLCNSLAVTTRIALSGQAVGLLPIQLVRAELAAGRVRRVEVSPDLPRIAFHLCYRATEYGPGVEAVVELSRALAREHGLFG